MVDSNIFGIFTPYLGKWSQFDEHIFSNGLKPPTSQNRSCCLCHILSRRWFFVSEDLTKNPVILREQFGWRLRGDLFLEPNWEAFFEPQNPQDHSLASWWFQIFFIFIPYFGEDEPNLTSIFFRWVGSTTNQLVIHGGRSWSKTLWPKTPSRSHAEFSHESSCRFGTTLSWSLRQTGWVFIVVQKAYLVLFTTNFSWMFGETSIFHVWNHPTETTMEEGKSPFFREIEACWNITIWPDTMQSNENHIEPVKGDLYWSNQRNGIWQMSQRFWGVFSKIRFNSWSCLR